jgi:catechol 2,3-dioxygenase-like lactoylglutathione lyase family enzyme
VERFISGLVADLERGKIDRRTFCESVALAAVVFAAGEGAANAAPAEGFQVLALNHISYTCPDYRVARDFYTSVFGMENIQARDNGEQTRLMFGPEPGNGGTYMVVRNGDAASDSRAFIDHICYTIPNWNEANIRSALSARGFDNPTGREGSLHVYDPFDFDVQFANSEAENPFR